MTESVHNFLIADFGVRITFKGQPNDMRLLPSLMPFAVETLDTAANEWSRKPSYYDGTMLFDLTIDDTLSPAPKAERERIRDFDTGNGITIVDSLPDGGYQYIIKDINGNDCCLLITDKTFANCRCALNGNYNMRSFGLNNALMLIFAFAGARRQTLLIHASLVRQHGYGFAFIAKSGTGKSTQVSMWLRYLPDCDLMNDDNPVVRVIDNQCFIYGSPWSGKTPCYRNIKAPLGAVTRIDRAEANSVEHLDATTAFASLLPSVSSMKWDKMNYEKICHTLAKIIEHTEIYILHCLPDRNSAEVCNSVIGKQKD